MASQILALLVTNLTEVLTVEVHSFSEMESGGRVDISGDQGEDVVCSSVSCLGDER